MPTWDYSPEGGGGGWARMNKRQEGRYKTTGKTAHVVKHPWYEAGPLNHIADRVDPDQ